MSVSAGHAKIKEALRELAVRWNGVQLVWQDENRRKFEETYVEPLLSELRTAEEALGYMDTLLNKVRRDCE